MVSYMCNWCGNGVYNVDKMHSLTCIHMAESSLNVLVVQCHFRTETNSEETWKGPCGKSYYSKMDECNANEIFYH